MNTDKTIFRVTKDRENPFAMIDRRALENPDLSWKAKGLLGYLLSRPDNWTIYMGDLVKRSTDGEHATRKAVDELIEAGHIVRKVEREKGRFSSFVLEVYENPIVPPVGENQEMDQPFGGFPQVDNPQVEKPLVENLPLNDIEFKETDSNEKKESAPPRTDAKKQGDILDGIFASATAGMDPYLALKARILQYPPETQQVLGWLAEEFGWGAPAIPERPVGKSSGKYGQWIMELHDVNAMLEGFGRTAIQAVGRVCSDLSISHPGSITWALPGEVGKLKKRSAAQTYSIASKSPFELSGGVGA